MQLPISPVWLAIVQSIAAFMELLTICFVFYHPESSANLAPCFHLTPGKLQRKNTGCNTQTPLTYFYCENCLFIPALHFQFFSHLPSHQRTCPLVPQQLC